MAAADLSAPSWVINPLTTTLAFDWQNNRAWAKDIGTFTPSAKLTTVRATAGNTAPGDAGTFSTFAANAPRITSRGRLTEDAATNLVQFSTDLTNAAWTSANVARTGGQAAPDGTTNAVSISDQVAAASHQISGAAVAFTSATVYTAYAIMKAGSSNFVQITLPSAQFSGVGYANFDLSIGAVSATGGTLVGSGITDLGSGWYLCWITATATASTSGSAISIFRINSGTATRALSYTGTSKTTLIWAAQTVAGSFPTSLIVTVGASLARDADIIQPAADIAALMQAAKSAYVRTQGLTGGTASRLVDFGGTASLRIAPGPTGATVAAVGSGSTATATISSSRKTANRVDALFSFNGTTNKATGSGGTQVTQAGAWGVTTETPTFGNVAAGGNALNGFVQYEAYSDQADAFTTSASYWGQVANNCRLPIFADTTSKQANSSSYHFFTENVTAIKIGIPHFALVQGIWTAMGGNGTVKAAIEYPIGTTPQRITFSGATQGTLTDEQMLVSDSFAVAGVAGQACLIHLYRTTAGNMPVFYAATGDLSDSALGEGFVGAASGLTDQTLVIGSPGQSPTVEYWGGPALFLAETIRPSVLVLGDSLMSGANETADSTRDSGWYCRSIAHSIGYLNAGSPAARVATFTAALPKLKPILAPYFSHMFSNFGRNDVSDGTSAANIVAPLRIVWASIPDLATAQGTITPYVHISTDGYTTVPNQTIDPDNAVAVSVNGTITPIPAPLWAVHNVAGAVLSGASSGKWRVDLASPPTSDGLHMLTAMSVAVAATAFVDPAAYVR